MFGFQMLVVLAIGIEKCQAKALNEINV